MLKTIKFCFLLSIKLIVHDIGNKILLPGAFNVLHTKIKKKKKVLNLNKHHILKNLYTFNVWCLFKFKSFFSQV